MHARPHQKHTADQIISILRKQPLLTCSQIRERLNDHDMPAQTRVVFKWLAYLKEVGVVISRKDQYSLSMLWLLQQRDAIAEGLSLLHSNKHNAGIDLTLQPGSSQKLIFDTLQSLTIFWRTLALQLMRRACTRIYLWHPDPWTYLLDPMIDLHFERSTEQRTHSETIVLGGISRFHREYAKLATARGLPVLIKPSLRKVLGQSDVAIYGHYLVTVTMDPKLQEAIARLFKGSKSWSEAQRDLGSFMVEHPQHCCVLKIEHHQNRAGLVRKRIEAM